MLWEPHVSSASTRCRGACVSCGQGPGRSPRTLAAHSLDSLEAQDQHPVEKRNKHCQHEHLGQNTKEKGFHAVLQYIPSQGICSDWRRMVGSTHKSRFLKPTKEPGWAIAWDLAAPQVLPRGHRHQPCKDQLVRQTHCACLRGTRPCGPKLGSREKPLPWPCGSLAGHPHGASASHPPCSHGARASLAAHPTWAQHCPRHSLGVSGPWGHQEEEEEEMETSGGGGSAVCWWRPWGAAGHLKTGDILKISSVKTRNWGTTYDLRRWKLVWEKVESTWESGNQHK